MVKWYHYGSVRVFFYNWQKRRKIQDKKCIKIQQKNCSKIFRTYLNCVSQWECLVCTTEQLLFTHMYIQWSRKYWNFYIFENFPEVKQNSVIEEKKERKHATMYEQCARFLTISKNDFNFFFSPQASWETIQVVLKQVLSWLVRDSKYNWQCQPQRMNERDVFFRLFLQRTDQKQFSLCIRNCI